VSIRPIPATIGAVVACHLRGENDGNLDVSHLPNNLGRSRAQMTCSSDQYYVITGRCSYVPCMISGRGSDPVITLTPVGGPKPMLTRSRQPTSACHRLSKPRKWSHRPCYRDTMAKSRRSLSGTQALSRPQSEACLA
jgi:hypothetical protein